MLPLSSKVTFHDTSRAFPGFVLFTPCGGTKGFLVDYNGEVTHDWDIGTGLTFCSRLLPNGNLFVNEQAKLRKGVALTGSGLMREYDAQSNLVWEHYDPYQHHDAQRLADGGAIYLAYTDMDPGEGKKIKGGAPNSESSVGICGEILRQVDENGNVVWERYFHEFGSDEFPLHRNANRWSTGHTNTIVVLDDGNYLISCKVLNLVFIIDCETGDMIWHYQNDAMGGQHDAQMLENGNILVFANGVYQSDLHYSQVWEIDPKTNEVVWQYKAKDNPQGFYSPHVGGCQRLENGHTLICEGAKGCIFEVTPQGDVVWEYINPFHNHVDGFGKINWLFRARHYLPSSSEIIGLGLNGS